MTPAPDPNASSSSFSGVWTPGQTLDDRYRIVALIGEGGMGEVYLADDLVLGEPVALKFLVDRLSDDSSALERFREEVRLAREVTHPGVARVHDIGVAQGRTFLSMEFVDGEDLQSLLRRIGRLPTEKAIEIARQVCSALAAAHARGVLHRDLKPGNVMLDGEGRVRLTDFGLASLAKAAPQGAAGTPAYMAPEQLHGAPASVATEVFSLGLFLYELFTGVRVFTGRNLEDLRRQHEEYELKTPSTHAADIDPVAERVILRCLAQDPAERPPSVRAVADALPGGDPLEAARIAGETPAPWLVVESGERHGLSLRAGALLLLATLVGLAFLITVSERTMPVHRAGLNVPPQALVRDARVLLDSISPAPTPLDAASGIRNGLAEYVQVLQGDSGLAFWYRDSPDWIVPLNRSWVGGNVLLNDPPHDLAGMRRALFTADGQLRHLKVVPAPVRATSRVDVDGAPDAPWEATVRATGLDLTEGREVVPRLTPEAAFDRQRAWEFDDAAESTVRLEIATFQDTIVWLRMLPDEGAVAAMDSEQASSRANLVFGLIEMVALVICGLIARFNLRRNRADQRTAFRLAGFSFISMMIVWVLEANHVPTGAELTLLKGRLSSALFRSAQLWVYYLALEPYFRRVWPHQLTSWIRLLNGQWRDSLVGRDLLIGASSAVWIMGIAHTAWSNPSGSGPDTGVAVLTANPIVPVLHNLRDLPLGMLMMLTVIVFGSIIFRRRWAGVALFVGLVAAVSSGEGTSVFGGVFIVCCVGVLLMRYGVLAYVAAPTLGIMLVRVPLGWDPSRWYADSAYPALFAVLAIAWWGFWTATAEDRERLAQA